MWQLPPLRLTGATILREGELRERSVAIRHGRISKGPLPAVDLGGYLILPGIVDLMARLPGNASAPLPARLKVARHACISAGVTTAWLASEDSQAAALLPLLSELAAGLDLRQALSIDIARADRIEAQLASILQIRPPLAYLENAPDHPAQMLPRQLCRIAETLDQVGTIYGSTHDSGGDMREMFSMIGAHIAALPASYSAAAAARAMGSPVLCSPERSALIRDLLRAGLITKFVSDGDPAAMVPRALELAGPNLADLPRIWPMFSAVPAEMMGLADRGSLDLGRRADVIIVNIETQQVEATINAGRLVFSCGEASFRFRATLASDDRFRVAAE